MYRSSKSSWQFNGSPKMGVRIELVLTIKCPQRWSGYVFLAVGPETGMKQSQENDRSTLMRYLK